MAARASKPRLLIVESPSKCRKIAGFLGPGWRVEATMGHVRALREDLGALGMDRGWEPEYEALACKAASIAKLREAAAACSAVYLATDDDREGEAIAWHVASLLRLDPATTPRVVFHEVTATALQAAVAAPQVLDLRRFEAQQARAMLDMLVGFTISKLLWRHVAPRLSAGRCQSPALRLVCERDEAIRAHAARTFFTLSAEVSALHVRRTATVPSEEAAMAVLRALAEGGGGASLAGKRLHATRSEPPPPLITSTLQQAASALHGLRPKETMAAAQRLYEAGHITYMRTDNAVLSVEFAECARAWVATTFGAEYVGPAGAHSVVVGAAAGRKAKGKGKGTAPPPQAAHEAIRPTHMEVTALTALGGAEQRVYRLVWLRAVQSQMAAALGEACDLTFTLEGDHAVWAAHLTRTLFAGWRLAAAQGACCPLPPLLGQEEEGSGSQVEEEEGQAWRHWVEEKEGACCPLPPLLVRAASLRWAQATAKEERTQPPPHYTEATLVRELEVRGIGRPSTFASILATLFERKYVAGTEVPTVVERGGGRGDRLRGDLGPPRVLTLAAPGAWPPALTTKAVRAPSERNRLSSTALGRSVADFLVAHFADLFGDAYSAALEGRLDAVAAGGDAWRVVLQDAWDSFKPRYEALAAAPGVCNRVRALGDGYKVVLSGKGPLLVLEAPAPPQTTQRTKGAVAFADLPGGTSFESVTRAQAEAAFEAKGAGEVVGHLDGQPVLRRSGRFGVYYEWSGTRVDAGEGAFDLAAVEASLRAKVSTTTLAVVGAFTIKRNERGAYMYKHANKKPVFVPWPEGVDASKVTRAEVAALYAAGLERKKGRHPPPSGRRARKAGEGKA